MRDVDGRLGGEVAVSPIARPRAAFIDRAARRRREFADEINLNVSEVLVFDERVRFAAANHRLVARGIADFSARERRLGKDDVVQQVVARRLGEKNLVITRDFESPGVAVLETELFEAAAVGLEAHHA